LGVQRVGYIYGRRYNTCIENFGRESSHLERDFMAGARLPTVGLCNFETNYTAQEIKLVTIFNSINHPAVALFVI